MRNASLSETTSVQTMTRPGEDVSAQVTAALDAGDFQRAYQLVTELIKLRGGDASDHLLAGVIALQLNNPLMSQTHFEQALALQPDNQDALYNLALLSLSIGDTDTAEAYFKHLRSIDPSNPSVYNDLGVVQLEKQRPHRALVLFRKALRLDPDFRAARNSAMEICLNNQWVDTAAALLDDPGQKNYSEITKAEINRWREIMSTQEVKITRLQSPVMLRNKKIAIFATHDAFIKDIAADLGRDNQVRKFDGDRLERMQELLRWADLAWFEWCDQLLIAATSLPKTCPIICRLHSYEAFTEMPGQVDWSKVDHLVFVNKSVQELVAGRIPATVPTTLIYNGVDLNRFALPADKPTTKKIASVGYINYKKNPALLLYAFKKIHEYDPEFTLHIAGQHQDPRIELYIANYLKRHPLPVFFEGWIEDMPGWYRDKQYVISTSLFESFHYSIAEGMASGCLPLVHDWYGADLLYPQKFLFGDPDECLGLVKKMGDADLATLRKENRAFIADRYRQEHKSGEIRSLMARVANRNSAK